MASRIFRARDTTELGFHARAMWETSADMLPTRRVPLNQNDFTPPRAVGDTTLDNCFAGWRPPATLRWTDRRLAAEIGADAACDHLVVYVPGVRRFSRRRARDAHDRRVQSRGPRRARHRHTRARTGCTLFLYDAHLGTGRMSRMSFPFECALDIKASLGECPVWSVDEQALYWVDINAPSLNRFDPATGSNTAWPMPRSIGCFALRRRGGFIVALRDGLWLASQNGRLDRKVAEAPYDPTHHRFNDGRADAGGRLWAGSMNENRDASTGALYRFDPDGVLVQVIPDMTISNGLAFSPDGRTMYHADTPARSVDAYDFDVATGTLANRRAFARFSGETDRPDGASGRQRRLLLERVLSRRKGRSSFAAGRASRRVRSPGDVSDDVRIRGIRPENLVRHERATDARRRRACASAQSGGIFAMRVDTPGMPEPKFAG